MNKQDIFNTLSLLFEFTEEEEDAIHGFIPMTQELFDSCLSKCISFQPRADKTYQKLIQKYPELYRKSKFSE